SNHRVNRPVDASSHDNEAARAAAAGDSPLRPRNGSTKEPPTDEDSVDSPLESAPPGPADEEGKSARKEGAAAANPSPRPGEDARDKKEEKEAPRTRYVGWAWDAVYAELGSPDFCCAGEWWYQGRDGE